MQKSTKLCNRVVVTGLGMVSPIGVGIQENWHNLLDGRSGIVSLKGDPEFLGLKSQIGGRLPRHFNINDYQTTFSDARAFSLANAVTHEAIIDAKLDFKNQSLNSDRVGIIIGNQFGAMENYMKPKNKLRLLKTMNHMVPALIAMQYGITGQLSTPSIASASGEIALGEAFRLIKYDYADICIAGGVDFNLNRHFFEGMELFGANCNTYNHLPQLASMPFDESRCGPVLSDGGGILVFESLESALKRKAKIYCEVGGYSQNTDGYHILRPTDNGIGLYKAFKEALVEAEMTPSMVDAVNSHATSTPAGDISEAFALKKTFGNKKIWNDLNAYAKTDALRVLDDPEIDKDQLKKQIITAQKGHIGHTFCAAGAIESIFAIMSLSEKVAPLVLNLKKPLDQDMTFAQKNVVKDINVIVKTALAFGGINSAIVFKTYKPGQ